MYRCQASYVQETVEAALMDSFGNDLSHDSQYVILVWPMTRESICRRRWLLNPTRKSLLPSTLNWQSGQASTWNKDDPFFIQEGLLCRKFYRNNDKTRSVLSLPHRHQAPGMDTHLFMLVTWRWLLKSCITQYKYWPRMSADIRHFRNSCNTEDNSTTH